MHLSKETFEKSSASVTSINRLFIYKSILPKIYLQYLFDRYKLVHFFPFRLYDFPEATFTENIAELEVLQSWTTYIQQFRRKIIHEKNKFVQNIGTYGESERACSCRFAHQLYIWRETWNNSKSAETRTNICTRLTKSIYKWTQFINVQWIEKNSLPRLSKFEIFSALISQLRDKWSRYLTARINLIVFSLFLKNIIRGIEAAQTIN